MATNPGSPSQALTLEKKKRIVACNECKRRKAKCHGGHPCAWCTSNSLECIIAPAMQRGDPAKKRRSDFIEYAVIDTRDPSMLNDLETAQYIEIYLKHIDPLFTMLGQWEKGSRLIYFIQPRSTAQFVTKYAACALVARGCGQKARAFQFASQARKLAASVFDEFSMDSLLAFLTLGAYMAGDGRLNMHYFRLAVSIFQSLNAETVPPHIRHFMSLSQLMINTTLSDTKKMRKLMAYTKNALPSQTRVQLILGVLLNLKVKIYHHLKCLSHNALRTDIMAIMGGHVVYTEEQRQHILAELQSCHNILETPEIQSDERIHTSLEILLRMYEVLVESRSGHADRALIIAKRIAGLSTYDALKFGSMPIRTRGDVENLLLTGKILYENQEYVLADKLHKLAEALNDLISDSPCDISNNMDTISAYLQSEYFHDNPETQHVQDLTIPPIVTKISSELFQLPSRTNSLMTPKAISECFETLCLTIPPRTSPFEIPKEVFFFSSFAQYGTHYQSLPGIDPVSTPSPVTVYDVSPVLTPPTEQIYDTINNNNTNTIYTEASISPSSAYIINAQEIEPSGSFSSGSSSDNLSPASFSTPSPTTLDNTDVSPQSPSFYDSFPAQNEIPASPTLTTLLSIFSNNDLPQPDFESFMPSGYTNSSF